MRLTDEEFQEVWEEAATEIADEYYPKGISKLRGVWLRDQALLFVRVVELARAKRERREPAK